MTTIYQQVGKFEILRRLGRGGMADVYLARDTEADRVVALKVLEKGTDQDALDTLAAERHGAILQARLCGLDPHVATVHEYGETDRFFFISMEHIEGEDLSTLLRQGPLPPARVIDIGIEVCSLLMTAHGLDLTVEGEPHHGVIHGDLKPKNIRITPDGRVKVLDFGIAKALSLTRKLTRNDFGSVAYASPERLESGEVDIHSDLWSVGVVLYELLVGRQPYQEVNTRRLEEVIRSRQTPPLLPESCPPGLQRVVARALAPQLSQRYPTAVDFKADLVALRENRPTIADLQPALHDPDATRRTSAVPPIPVVVSDADATRRTSPVAPLGANATAEPVTPVAPVAAVAAAAPSAPVAPKAARKRLFRRPFRVAILVLLLFVALREMSALNAAATLRAELPLKERADMDAVWSEFQELGERSPLGIGIAGLREPFKARLVDFADRILNGYRSDVVTLRERDWEDARRYLSRALSVGGSDRLVRARLRYSEGHLHRINGDARLRRPQEARGYYNDAVVAFEDAARLNPAWPDPHLGLARVYFYGLEDLEKGVEALEAAEKAGFKPGNRETALRADAYRRRGERLWREALAMKGLPQEDEVLERAAAADREALKLYGAIIGFGDAATQVTRTERHVRLIEARLADLRAPVFEWPW
jgi:serine/threonine protein kinase/tetratricopeptide (TPR) repeat protein